MLAHAGTLDPTVRSYIEEGQDFQVACEIPGLEITNDGSVLGGQTAEGVDALAAVQSLAAQDVGVVVGPDSIGTLSFTSGSTGIPKGKYLARNPIDNGRYFLRLIPNTNPFYS